MRIFIRLKALLSPAGRRQNLNRFQNQFQNLTDKRLRLYWCRSPFRRLGGGGEVGEGCQRGENNGGGFLAGQESRSGFG